jgi:hypothetical protein
MAGLEYLPEMAPQKYGIAVHVAFGVAVRVANLPGVGEIERSFSLEDSDPRYGLAGTVRTDVTLRNIQGDIIAIYDVKTGDRQMLRPRADELREKTGAAPGNSSSISFGGLHENTIRLAGRRRDVKRRAPRDCFSGGCDVDGVVHFI